MCNLNVSHFTGNKYVYLQNRSKNDKWKKCLFKYLHCKLLLFQGTNKSQKFFRKTYSLNAAKKKEIEAIK